MYFIIFTVVHNSILFYIHVFENLTLKKKTLKVAHIFLYKLKNEKCNVFN